MKARIALCAALFLAALPVAGQDTTEQPKFEVAKTAPAASPTMSVPQAVILGAVEGLTEYLPVSSTGHLTIVQGLLGLWRTPQEKDASNAYAICIQAGAIIAVFVLYFGRIKGMVLRPLRQGPGWPEAARQPGRGPYSRGPVRGAPGGPDQGVPLRRVARGGSVAGRRASSSSRCWPAALHAGARRWRAWVGSRAHHRADPGAGAVARGEPQPGHDHRRRCSSGSRCRPPWSSASFSACSPSAAATIYEGLKVGPRDRQHVRLGLPGDRAGGGGLGSVHRRPLDGGVPAHAEPGHLRLVSDRHRHRGGSARRDGSDCGVTGTPGERQLSLG